MLRVSSHQFQQIWFERFTDKISLHLRQYFELPCRVAGEFCVRETIRLGVARARYWGLTLEASAQSYIDHMMLLGSHFDADPQLPWAKEVLERPQPELVRLDSLHAQTQDHLARTAGAESRNLFLAVARARRNGLDPQLTAPPSRALGEVTFWLKRLYPEKYRRVYHTVPSLIAHAEATGLSLGFSEPRALARILGLMFLAGGGVCEEPMMPWVGAILRDKARPAGEREEELWQSLAAYADRWLTEARAQGILAREAPGEGAEGDVQ
ncbi:MAG TPA: hypothetical protein VER33_22250 [Polyangiaceae bacterium]|nr:hypothetical protein [Polyangiaceae bacterium]